MEFNWDNINESVKQNAQYLEDFLQDEIIKEGLLKTGNLAGSVKVLGRTDDRTNETTFTITMNDYGFYQDSGVYGQGQENRVIANSMSYFTPGRFRKPTIPWAPRTKFSFAAARSIAQKGLKPRPFILEALTRFEKKVGDDLEQATKLDVEDALGKIFMKSGAKLS
jgi:hypothetical protein